MMHLKYLVWMKMYSSVEKESGKEITITFAINDRDFRVPKDTDELVESIDKLIAVYMLAWDSKFRNADLWHCIPVHTLDLLPEYIKPEVGE